MNQKTDRWDAQDYARNSSAQSEWADELIAKLCLQGNERGLDLGCGDGRITAAIAAQLPRGEMVGIDLSENMIALARDRFEAARLRFAVMDVTGIDFERPFDFVFSNAALHWVADHPAVLARLREHLVPGAKILFQMGGYGNASAFIAVLTGLMRSPEWSPYFVNFAFPYHFFDIADYHRWLPQAGYEALRVELIPKDMVHPHPDQLLGWLRTTWFPFTDCLPPEFREQFLSKVVEAYLDGHPVDSEGRTHVRMVRLEVEAVAVSRGA